MKPPRSKRAGPAARARGDSACRSSSRLGFGSARTVPGWAAAVDACTSLGRGARDRQPRSAEGIGAGSSTIVPRGRWRTNSTGCNADRAAEEGTRAAPAPFAGLRLPSPAGLPGVYCSQCSLRDGRRRVRTGGTWRLGSPSEAGRLLDPS